MTGPGALSTTAAPRSGQLRIAQYNVFNFFDTVDAPDVGDEVLTRRHYDTKQAKLSLAVRDVLKGADLVALQEVENQKVLDDLLARPEMAKLGYRSILVPGNDARGINVALLYRDDTIDVRKVDQLRPDDGPLPPAGGQIDPDQLFARPPLAVDLTFKGASDAAEGARNLTVVVNHFKSKRGGDSAADTRRARQGEWLGEYVDKRRAQDPSASVVVLGDLNALPGEKPIDNLLRRKDGSTRLVDLPSTLPKDDRYTYIFRGEKNLLDHLMVTDELASAHVDTQIPHINSGDNRQDPDPRRPNGLSDHDPILSTFDFAAKPPAS